MFLYYCNRIFVEVRSVGVEGNHNSNPPQRRSCNLICSLRQTFVLEIKISYHSSYLNFPQGSNLKLYRTLISGLIQIPKLTFLFLLCIFDETGGAESIHRRELKQFRWESCFFFCNIKNNIISFPYESNL